MPQVSTGFVDGSRHDYEEDQNLMVRLKQLQSQGLEGRKLVDALLTDDWGPPPKWVTIQDGETEVTISC